jgi:hypothetical protein
MDLAFAFAFAFALVFGHSRAAVTASSGTVCSWPQHSLEVHTASRATISREI